MRQQLIVTAFLAVFLIITMVIKHLYFPELHGQSAYYFLSAFWICGILIVILGLNLIWRCLKNPHPPANDDGYSQWANRRTTFRIIYPAFLRPTLVVENIDGTMERFSGHIRFNSGDCTHVAGKLIRKVGTQVSIQFLEAMKWSTLLDEQRRVLARMKSAP